MTIPYVQRKATRTPDDGKTYLADVATLAYTYASTGTALELAIAASSEEPILLLDVYHIVRTAFAGGTPAIDIGDGSDVDAYIDQTDITETSAGNVVRSSDKANAKSNGEYLTSARKLTVTLSASLTAGAATLVAVFYRLA